MITKNEYLYAKKKKEDLRFSLNEYEIKSATYQMWTKWNSMGQEEKDKLIAQWEVYYQQARDSYYGKKYQEAQALFRDWTKTKNGESKKKLLEIVQEVKQAGVAFIKKPSTVDPRDLPMKLREYFEIKRKQEEYETIYEEYKDVFETRKSSDDSL